MNTMRKPYDRIEDVLRAAGKPLAAHEFTSVMLPWPKWIDRYKLDENINGREYVGLSEATIARRLREMAGLTRVNAFKRAGKNFVEYALIEAPVGV